MRLPLISAALLGASLLALPVSASAAQFAGFSNSLPVQTQTLDNSLVQKVRYYRRHYRHDDGGAIAAGAIIGLALGAIIAGGAAQQNAAIESCARRYRSYNPRSQTWVDYHGRIHRCP